MRKQPLFQTRHKHTVKLQPLGGVNRHQLKCILAGAGLMLAGFQRGMRQKLGDDLRRIFRGKAHRGGNQFVQVLQPLFAAVLVALIHCAQPAEIYQVADQLGK